MNNESYINEMAVIDDSFLRDLHLKGEFVSQIDRLSIAKIDSTVKRMIDIVGSLFLLLLSLPIFMIVPALIKLSSKGPVFYLQNRVGQNKRDIRKDENISDGSFNSSSRRKVNLMGRPFKLIKFRTMIKDAEEECGPVWAVKDDPRITPIGNFLRKTRIDEIPQLINVLKGEMSLVGPRPERLHFVQDFVNIIPGYELRLSIKPGVTGLAQISNGYDTSIKSVFKKVAYDLDYIRNWSFWKEVKILFKTVFVVITTKGAI